MPIVPGGRYRGEAESSIQIPWWSGSQWDNLCKVFSPYKEAYAAGQDEKCIAMARHHRGSVGNGVPAS
jgi:hypothetical protein